MPEQEKANLARIRDNQRRSRARRKEYLAELEGKLRQCEIQGIEASSEIQHAARRVAEENKKLRKLLGHHGVHDDAVNAYLQSPSGGASVIESEDAGVGSTSYGNATNGAVQALEQLLMTRRECCVNISGNASAEGSPPRTDSRLRSSTPHQRTGSRGSSVSTAHSGWEGSEHGQPHPQARFQQQQGPVLLDSTSSNIRSRSVGYPNSQPGMAHHSDPIQFSHRTPRDNHLTHAPTISNVFDFDPRYQRSSSNSSVSYGQHSLSGSSTSPYINNLRTPSTTNVNSCMYATDMITAMAGGDPTDIRSDLGCLSGMDCEVDNQLVFNVMDRYNTGL